MIDDGYGSREAGMTGGGFGSPPWGPVDPAPSYRDGVQGEPGPAESRPRWAGSADETAVDAFTPIPRGPGLGTGSPGGAKAPRTETGGPGTRAPGVHRAARGKRPSPPSRPSRRRSFWRELPVLVVIALALALIVKTFVVQAFFIPSGSMQNTLAIGDRVLVNKVIYHVRGIDRGDIVVFNGEGSWDFGGPATPSNPVVRFVDAVEGVVGITHGSDVYIKRVIGLPGDHVACCTLHGQVTVNGVPLYESSYLYPGNPPSQQKFSITVPPGRLWVMGDHRDVSYDSRGHMGDPGGGTIPESAVLGRAFVIVWPPSQWTFLNIPITFEQPALTSASAAGGSPAALAAALNGNTASVAQSWTPLPLAAGVTGAVPLTWLQRRARTRLAKRRRSRSATRAELPARPRPGRRPETSAARTSRRPHCAPPPTGGAAATAQLVLLFAAPSPTSLSL
ncbi:MAG TPA: signal peptidase I [Trebonia sp.]